MIKRILLREKLFLWGIKVGLLRYLRVEKHQMMLKRLNYIARCRCRDRCNRSEKEKRLIHKI